MVIVVVLAVGGVEKGGGGLERPKPVQVVDGMAMVPKVRVVEWVGEAVVCGGGCHRERVSRIVR